MNITRHPDATWLLDYANGTLTPGFELLLSAHLAACPDCAMALRDAERLGAELMLGGPASALTLKPDTIFDHEEDDSAWIKPRPANALERDRVDLQQLVGTYLDCGLGALPWRSAGKGLKIARLRAGPDEKIWLLRAAPDTVLPRHTHGGSELTLVLKGAYFARDAIYSAGDVEDADETVDHQPVVTRDGECICLAVTEAPLRFHGWLPRLAQGFLGI